MQGWLWRTIIFGAVVTVLVYTATRPDPETMSLYSSTPAELVDSLTSSRDSVRRHAAARLLAHGRDAVPALMAQIPEAQDDDLEQLFLVLEDLYVSSDPPVADAAEAALEQLSVDRRKEVRRATEELFQANFSRRHLRACAKLEAMGAKLVSSPFKMSVADIQFASDIAVVDAGWTGGDAGLKQLSRLRGLVAVHVADDADISPQAITELGSLVSVRRQHEACLGVELRDLGGRLTIRRLVPNSPADRGGLEASDQLLAVSGLIIRDFSDFSRQLRSQRPGETTEMLVLRGEQEVTLYVELGTDFGTGRCRCLDDDSATESPAAEVAADEARQQQGAMPDRPRRSIPSTDRLSPLPGEGPRPRAQFEDYPPAADRRP